MAYTVVEQKDKVLVKKHTFKNSNEDSGEI